MKLVIGLGSVGCIALVSVFVWFSRDPVTQLLDASGEPLVAATGDEESYPASETRIFALARRQLDGGNYSAAKTELLRILEEEQHDGVACVLLSRAARKLDQVDEAVDYGLKAVQLLPEHAPAHLEYSRALGMQLMRGVQGPGDILRAAGLISRFHKELELVVQYDPEDIEARTMQVFAAMAPVVGNANRALAVAKEIEAINGLIGKKMLAYAYSHKGEVDQALGVCRSGALEYPADNGFPLILGGLLRDQERFEEARQAYAEVRDVGPRNEDFHLSLIKQAEMQIEQRIELQEALELMQRFIEARPVGDWIPAEWESHYLLGAAYLALGKEPEARAAFEQSLSLQPNHKRSKKALESLN